MHLNKLSHLQIHRRKIVSNTVVLALIPPSGVSAATVRQASVNYIESARRACRGSNWSPTTPQADKSTTFFTYIINLLLYKIMQQQ